MSARSLSARATTAVIAGGVALIIAAGLLIERFDLFSSLTFAVQRNPDRMPSTLAVPDRDVRAGLPIVSLVARASDLNDPERGLLTHPLERGKEFERPAYVSFFEQGRLQFAAQAGLRIHGGKSRENSPVQSFRLYFEREYGAGQFARNVLFEGRSDPLRQIVLHNDLRRDLRGTWWHFVNPLAFDIARQIGAIVPHTEPARVVLNGETQGAYVLTEHVTSRGFQEAHFGHRAFTVADGDALDRLWRWQRERPTLSTRAVNRVVDVDNLTNWFISLLFCATTDAFQGVMLHDDSTPDGRWFWVNWDMDHSFMDLYQQAPVPWEHDTFATLMSKREIRSSLVTRLLDEDPEYAVRFKQTLADALNHRLTPSFLRERFDHYGRIARLLQVPDQDYLPVLSEFLDRRATAIRALAPSHLPRGESYRATVIGPAGASFDIDGFGGSSGYEGWYFRDTTIRVTPVGQWAGRWSHWLVNGQRVTSDSPTLSVTVTQDLRIEAVTR